MLLSARDQCPACERLACARKLCVGDLGRKDPVILLDSTLLRDLEQSVALDSSEGRVEVEPPRADHEVALLRRRTR